MQLSEKVVDETLAAACACVEATAPSHDVPWWVSQQLYNALDEARADANQALVDLRHEIVAQREESREGGRDEAAAALNEAVRLVSNRIAANYRRGTP